jgi:DNA-directed RNA polymerase specialized sigma24 family protein
MSNYSFKDEEWENLYPLLHARVARWVYTSRIPLWMKQREAVINDIVGEAILKTFAYTKRAERGEAREIDSLESICSVTAYHCYVDAHRRDQRILPLMPEYEEPVEAAIIRVDVDLSEQAIDNVYDELVFIQTARWIVNFPDKQRTALLVDLANRMYFHPFQSTPLQEAFASVGIDMYTYNRPLPSDAKARARHAAHLSLAYKRLALLAYMQRYMFVA